MKGDVKDILKLYPWLEQCVAEGAVKVSRVRRGEIAGEHVNVRTAQMFAE